MLWVTELTEYSSFKCLEDTGGWLTEDHSIRCRQAFLCSMPSSRPVLKCCGLKLMYITEAHKLYTQTVFFYNMVQWSQKTEHQTNISLKLSLLEPVTFSEGECTVQSQLWTQGEASECETVAALMIVCLTDCIFLCPIIPGLLLQYWEPCPANSCHYWLR